MHVDRLDITINSLVMFVDSSFIETKELTDELIDLYNTLCLFYDQLQERFGSLHLKQYKEEMVSFCYMMKEISVLLILDKNRDYWKRELSYWENTNGKQQRHS